MDQPQSGPKGGPRPKLPVATAAGVAGVAALVWSGIVDAATAPPEIWAADGDLKRRVLPWCSKLHEPYKPTPYAINTHVQNVLTYVRGKRLDAGWRRQLVVANDGGTLGLDWFRGCDDWRWSAPDTPVLLILHGINGGSHEGYCKWVAAYAAAQGWRAAVLNYRGCNGLPLTSPRGYSATLTHDVHFAVTSIKGRFPSAPVFAVGYSLGGLFLTKYLAEADLGLHTSPACTFTGSGLVAAAVVSTPFCLFHSSEALARPWTTGYAYNMAVAYKMREFMAQHRAAIRAGTTLDVDAAMRHWTVGPMEDTGIPSTFGFANRQEYYEQSASLRYIPHITTPTLFLVSRDDPFLGVLPDEECSANPHTILAVTRHGGHVAFLQGWWPFKPAYMDMAVMEFLQATWKHLPSEEAAQPAATSPEAAAAQRARAEAEAEAAEVEAAAAAGRDVESWEGSRVGPRSWLGLDEEQAAANWPASAPADAEDDGPDPAGAVAGIASSVSEGGAGLPAAGSGAPAASSCEVGVATGVSGQPGAQLPGRSGAQEGGSDPAAMQPAAGVQDVGGQAAGSGGVERQPASGRMLAGGLRLAPACMVRSRL